MSDNSQLKEILQNLGFKANQIKVYLALTELGENTAATIAKQANLPRTTVISILESLMAEGYITMHRYRGTAYYWVESPQVIVDVFKQKTVLADELRGTLAELYRVGAHFPAAQIFDTKSSIRNFIEKLIASLPRKFTIYTIDAPSLGNYSKIFSEGIGTSLLRLKKSKEILTKTLIPRGLFATIAAHKLTAQDIEIRELPGEINFISSLWLTRDNLVFFSGNPPFIVSVKHDAIVASFHSLYLYLWSISQAPAKKKR